jgi:hypothetical protein
MAVAPALGGLWVAFGFERFVLTGAPGVLDGAPWAGALAGP